MVLWTFMYNILRTYVSISQVYVGMGLPSHIETLYLIFWGIAKLFLIVTTPLYISISNTWGFLFLLILSTCYFLNFCGFILFRFIYYNYLSQCEVLSHCGFDLISLIINDRASFIYSLAIYIFSLKNAYLYFFTNF